jgi:hypothetical protein
VGGGGHVYIHLPTNLSSSSEYEYMLDRQEGERDKKKCLSVRYGEREGGREEGKRAREKDFLTRE